MTFRSASDSPAPDRRPGILAQGPLSRDPYLRTPAQGSLPKTPAQDPCPRPLPRTPAQDIAQDTAQDPCPGPRPTTPAQDPCPRPLRMDPCLGVPAQGPCPRTPAQGPLAQGGISIRAKGLVVCVYIYMHVCVYT